MPSTQMLIVDDDAMLGDQLRELLGVLGHAATYCQDATKALALLERNPFELIFCDYWMPGVNGQNFYREVTQKQPQLAGRIVFLTGGVLSEETQFFIKSTGNLQLLKPLKLTSVKQVLAAALSGISAPEPFPPASPDVAEVY